MPDIVVLDLDDTLYPEMDYVRSGIRHVAQYLRRVTGRDVDEALQKALNSGDDWLSAACSLVGWPDSAKTTLLWMYRLHEPEITLAPDVRDSIRTARANAEAVVILTDGRSATQRLKAGALGLDDLEILVSEEWGADKPDPTRFEHVTRRWPGRRYAYVGDNPQKDFVAPNALGWRTVGVRTAAQPVHRADLSQLPPGYRPEAWVESLDQALSLLGIA